jgi:peptidyl-prolyl cis-trans isomerase C
MKLIKTICMLVLLAMLAVPPVSCAKGEKPAESAPPAGDAVPASSADDPATGEQGSAAAMVNGTAIPMSEVELAVKNTAIRMGVLGTPDQSLMDRLGPQIVNQLIAGEVLYQEAVKQGYTAAGEKVDESFNSLAGQFPSREEFNTEMEKRGYTESSLKASMRKQITIQAFLDETIASKTSVTEQEARSFFDENPDRFSQEAQVKASHILINAPSEAPQEEKDKALKRAREITELARGEGADFAALAKEHSEGPSGPSGGDLGFFGRGRMVKPFEEAAFSMKVGEISDPVLTQFGYHVIKVTDRQAGKTMSFEEVKDNLMAGLKNDKVNRMVNDRIKELSEKAEIEVFLTSSSSGGPSGLPPGHGSVQ